MANKTPRLQGWADKPSEPGWQKRAVQLVKERQKKTHRWTERKDGVLATFDIEMKALLTEAARRRNISMAGYARRAIAAFIAHDLGIAYEDVTKYCALPTEFRATAGAGRSTKLNDDGEGHGLWQIRKLM
jgi:hypothetical protein